MTRSLQVAVASLLLACAPAAPPREPVAGGKAEPVRKTLLCADTRMTARGHMCVRPLSEEEQRHRALSIRLQLEDGLPVRLFRLNGRGFAETDDDGCWEYRYRFEAGYIAESTGYRPDGTVCDRSLYREHATQVAYVDAWGRPNFDKARLHTASLFERDADGMVTSQRGLDSDGKPTEILRASEVRFERDAARLEKRTCYFDAQGRPQNNSANSHCVTIERDEFGNELRVALWDVQGEPALNNSGVHAFVREFDRWGNLRRRTLLGRDGQVVSTETERCPVLRYLRDSFGFSLGVDCLDGAGKPARFDEGNAMWRATPDARGRPREHRYYDERGNPYVTEHGTARVEVTRDDLGHVTERRYFLADGSPGQDDDGPPVERYQWNAQHLEVKRSTFSADGRPWRHRGCAATTFEYDQRRQLLRATCLGFEGEPAMSWDGVSSTLYGYDQRGLISEMRYLDPAGKPVDGRRGYARKLLSYDARGIDHDTRHFKADGTELTLRRFSVLWVRPPHADPFWPERSRPGALARIEQAERELRAGLPWESALLRFGDEDFHVARAGDTGYLNPSSIFPVIARAIEPLAVGQYSRIVEIPYGFALYLRTE